MKPLLETKKLEKRFGEHRALKGISFDLYPGEILCFLGPNGAGKTTAINLLSTTLKPDGGEIRFEGRPVAANPVGYKRNLGIVPQDLAIYEQVPAEENVRFFAALYGLRGRELRQRVDEALSFAGLFERRKEKPAVYSGGMKRRLNIACAIAHQPRVIIMDEPTVGIDPQSRNYILESIRRLREQGRTILYSTHYMEEVEEISTRIMIIDHGEIIAAGTNEQLKEQYAGDRMYEITVESPQGLRQNDLYRIDGIKKVQIRERQILLTVIKGVENLDRIIAFLMAREIRIQNITGKAAGLERVFLSLTGRSLRN